MRIDNEERRTQEDIEERRRFSEESRQLVSEMRSEQREAEEYTKRIQEEFHRIDVMY